MNKTEKLKNIIISRYGSIREFSKIVDIPSTTLTSALDRGIGGMAIDRVIKVCDILNVDVKTFEPLPSSQDNISLQEKHLLSEFKKLNDIGKKEAIKRVEELTYIDKYTTPHISMVADDFNDYLMPIAAHNDNDDSEQQKLMQKDIDEL